MGEGECKFVRGNMKRVGEEVGVGEGDVHALMHGRSICVQVTTSTCTMYRHVL